MSNVAKGGLKAVKVCGYCCVATACTVETARSAWYAITMICTCGQGWKGMVDNFISMFTSIEDLDYKDFDLPVAQEKRYYTDLHGFLLFLANFVGMCFVMNRSIAYGKPEVFENGVDSWGNVCGWTYNTPYSESSNSGQNMSIYNKVLIAELLTNPHDVISGVISPENQISLCVEKCPALTRELNCESYIRKHTNYPSNFPATLCSRGNDDGLTFIEKNNRCVPVDLLEEIAIQRQNELLNLYGKQWFHNLLQDCETCAAELTWLVLVAIGFTLLFIIVIHGAAKALVWYSFATFFIIGIIASSYMWYLYTVINSLDIGVSVYSGRSAPQQSILKEDTFQGSLARMSLRLFPQSIIPEGRSGVPQAGYSIVFRDTAIVSTTGVVLFSVICILVGRRNMNACAHLFEQCTESLMSLQWIYILPFLSIASLSFGLGLWMFTVKRIAAIFLDEMHSKVDSSTGFTLLTYVSDDVYSTWVLLYEILSMVWIFNFIMACQHLLATLAVGTWYFTITKEKMFRPMRVANTRLWRKHIGSAVMGSLFSGFFGFIRAPLR